MRILSRSLSIDRWWKTCWWDILIHRKTNEWMLYESLEVCLASHTRSWIRYHHVARVFYIVVVFRCFSSFVFPFYQVGTGSSPPTGSWISNLIPFGPSAPKTPTRTTASAPKVWKRNYAPQWTQFLSLQLETEVVLDLWCGEIFCFQSFSELFVSFLESESEVPRSSGEASGRVTNPLLSGMTPQQSTASHVPRGLPMATSTPIGTPSRSNAPPLPPLPQSAVSRPPFSAPGEGVTR